MLKPFKALLLAPLLVALALACSSDEQELFVPYDLPPELEGMDLSYLPFEYLRDGCMYRAAYLGMEFAVAGLPAVALQAQDCDMKRSIHGPAGERWRVHVVGGFVEDGQVKVVDPGFSDALLTPDQWLAFLDSDNLNVRYNPSAYPQAMDGANTCHSESGQENIVATVGQMTPFDPENMAIWCSYLRRYLRDAGQDEDGSREALLVARSAELFDALLDLGLISSMGEAPAKGSFACPPPLDLP
jgi:hypothetical protein